MNSDLAGSQHKTTPYVTAEQVNAEVAGNLGDRTFRQQIAELAPRTLQGCV